MFEGTVEIIEAGLEKKKTLQNRLDNVGYMVCHHYCTDCVYGHSSVNIFI